MNATPAVTASTLIESARRTLSIELDAIAALDQRLDSSFVRACKIILNCRGRVVVLGMGKSGHIGRKIAATLAEARTIAEQQLAQFNKLQALSQRSSSSKSN